MPGRYERFAAFYDKLMYDCDYPAWSQYFLQLLAERGVTAGRGLDFACGSGKVTAELARAGFTVTGVDLSQEMLTEAAKNLAGLMGRVRLLCRDMTEFALRDKQDFITCVLDGVNYLPPKQLPRFFENCARNLRSGGVLLFDISSAYKIEHVLRDNIFADDTEDVTYLWQNDYAGGYVDMDLIFFVREGGSYYKFTEQHRMYRYEISDVVASLNRAGFAKIEAYGFMTQNAPGPKEQRIQFAAVKA